MTPLDAEELLHLGLHATRNNDPEAALGYLKQSLAMEPDNAQAVYLLAANYAQIGLYDRARELFERTLELAPREYTAAFQLGLLHMTGGDLDAARETWARLDELDEENALHRYKSALLALGVDDFPGAVALFDAGLRAGDGNAALNADMQRIRDAAALLLQESHSAANPQTDVIAPGAGHFVLSHYQQSREPS